MFIYGPKNSSTMESDLSLQLSYGLGKKGNLANLQKQNVKVYKCRTYVQRSGVCMVAGVGHFISVWLETNVLCTVYNDLLVLGL